MQSFQEKLQVAPKPELSAFSVGQIFLLFLLFGWLALAPILVGIMTASLPAGWIASVLAVIVLAGLLLLPFVGITLLAYYRKWANMWPFSLALLATGLYIAVATGIRAGEGLLGIGADVSLLRLTLFIPFALLLGGLMLYKADIPGWMLPHAFGFDKPSLAGLLTTLALIALLTIGWPISGTLGDSWTTLFILIQALAISLPEEIFFRGAILGVITYNFQQRKAMAAIVSLLLYMAFTPSQIVPNNDWSKLLLLISAIPFALLMVELRALTGGIWAGILFAWIYRAVPLLFTDPRSEFAAILQPWQTVAHLYLVFGGGIMALLLLAGRRRFTENWPLSKRGTTVAALSAAILMWSLWAGLWFAVGQPGFYNDGFLIIMEEQADLSGAEAIIDPVTRRTFVRDRLIKTAERTQAEVRLALDKSGLDYRPFYLINMIQIKGNSHRMDEFNKLPGVAKVMINPNSRPYPFNDLDIGYQSSPESQGVEWNVSQIKADKLWQKGITGQGIVVGGQDTGYDWQHPALRRNYRGVGKDGKIDHNYNWHDSWSDAAAPYDKNGHGTHTMGTMVGDDEQGNQVGIAPDARWIGCRNMERGLGNPASYTECMEFFLAPYPLGGNPFTDGDVTMSPHIINNSWGCPDNEGCDDGVLEPATAALRAAGIMMVVSAGNDGSKCQTVSEPPARYDNVFSVGAVDSGGQITGFSSRGPVSSSQPPLLKPDISAPGSNIRSSLPGGRYGLADGTSMAGPHVVGVIALLWSANPALIGQIDATEEIIRKSARQVKVSATCPIDSVTTGKPSLLEQLNDLENPTTCACGGIEGVPNNVYGWGEIDALAAVELALEMKR